MSINEVRYLPECGSTNAYMKEHFEEFCQMNSQWNILNQKESVFAYFSFLSP